MTILNNPVKVQVDNIVTVRSDQHLQQSCLEICKEFPDLWKQELGRLKGYQLEVKFKPDVTPRFCKPRTVPFAVQEDLNQAYDAGITNGIWEPFIFNEYGTPVVPVRNIFGTSLWRLLCIHQCAPGTNRQPMPLPENLMRKLGGTHFFSKVDLADAYNQIELGPDNSELRTQNFIQHNSRRCI